MLRRLVSVTFASCMLASIPLAARGADDTADAIRTLKTGSEQDRVRAAAALGTPWADGRSIDALAEAAETGSAVLKAAAIRALAKTGKPEAVAPLAQATIAAEASVAEEAREALKSVANARTAAALVAAFEANVAARARMVPALVAANDPKTSDRLGAALADANGEVRVAADRAVRLASRDLQMRALTTCLGAGADRERMPCVSLAIDLGDRKLVPLLAPVATDPFGDAMVRDEARKALGAMKDDLDAPKLAETARSAKSAGERAQALAMLSIAGGERAYVALTRALSDPEEIVRARAAFCLGEFGDQRAVKMLSTAADDPRNARVRKVVQGALDKLLAR